MTTVVSGELKRTDLCEDCARESGAVHPSGFLSAEALMTAQTTAPASGVEKCPACGYTLESLQKTGRFGCGVCYEKFSGSLRELLQESQKSLTHTGKRPGRKKAGREELEAELGQLSAIDRRVVLLCAHLCSRSSSDCGGQHGQEASLLSRIVRRLVRECEQLSTPVILVLLNQSSCRFAREFKQLISPAKRLGVRRQWWG